jgi:hypothetical protein
VHWNIIRRWMEGAALRDVLKPTTPHEAKRDD